MLPIAGQTAGLIGLNFFCGQSWEAWECLRLKKLMLCFKQERKITQMEDINILVNNIRLFKEENHYNNQIYDL